MSHLDSKPVRRALRALAVVPAVAVTAVSAPALAAPPETWPEGEAVGAFDMLLVIVLIPLGLALTITVLAYVPRLAKGEKYTPGLAWRNENEWFGGPKDGLEASDRTDPKALTGNESDRGGASARW